jgi:hypothetical protein
VFGPRVCHPQGVQAAQGAAPRPGRRRLALAIVGLACTGVVVFALWRLAGFAGTHSSATSADRHVTATVRGGGSCQGADTQDTVSFTLDGQVHQAKLDGCGHQAGETLEVLVPASFDGNTVLAQADAAPGDSAGLSHRVAFLLLVATAVGGACGYGLFRTRRTAAQKRADKLTRTLRRRERADRAGAGRIAVAGVAGGAGTGPAAEALPADGDTVPGGRDPRDTSPEGVDWFEDSSTSLSPVDLGEPADRS